MQVLDDGKHVDERIPQHRRGDDLKARPFALLIPSPAATVEIEERPKLRLRTSSWLKADTPHEVGESCVGAQRIQQRPNFN